MSNIKANTKPKRKYKHIILQQLHIYGILTAQTIASSILIAFILWLFIRQPEPQVHVTGLTVDALDKSNTSNRTLLHYNLTLHNPDLYKSINYDVLILRITYSTYPNSYGDTINFIADGKALHQWPRETTLLANHTIDYTDYNVQWPTDQLIKLKTDKTFLKLRVVTSIRVMVFNRFVIAKRQMMQIAEVYFDDDGKAFIDSSHGLRLK